MGFAQPLIVFIHQLTHFYFTIQVKPIIIIFILLSFLITDADQLLLWVLQEEALLDWHF